MAKISQARLCICQARGSRNPSGGSDVRTGEGERVRGVIPAAVHAGRAAKAECARGAIPVARAGRIAGMNKTGRAMRSHRTKRAAKARRAQKGAWIRLTDKELRRLRRTELLELMIEGKQAVAAAEEKVAQVEEQMRKLQETYERLCRKLDDKDEKIRELRAELQSARDNKQLIREEHEEVAAVTARLNEAVAAAEQTQKLFEAALRNAKKKTAGAGDEP